MIMFGRHSGDGWLQSGIVAYLIVYAIIYFFNLRKKNKKQQRLITGLFFATALIIDMTIFPIPIGETALMHIIEKHEFSINLVPLINVWNAIIYLEKRVLLELILNILLFVPFGYFARQLYSNLSWKQIILYGFLVSLCIEMVQLMTLYNGFNTRVFDVDDLIMNTIGSFIGSQLVKLKK